MSLTLTIGLIVYPAFFAWVAIGMWVSHIVTSRYGLSRLLFWLGILVWPLIALWLLGIPILAICERCRRAVAGRVLAQNLEETELDGYDQVSSRRLEFREKRATSGADIWGDDHV